MIDRLFSWFRRDREHELECRIVDLAVKHQRVTRSASDLCEKLARDPLFLRTCSSEAVEAWIDLRKSLSVRK